MSVITIITCANASEVRVNPTVMKSFNSAFKEATNVTWSESNELFKVEFFSDDRQHTAVYNAQGELVSVGRKITSYQLPLLLQMNLEEKMEQQKLKDLFEVNNEEGTAYYAVTENDKFKLTYKSSQNGTWGIYSKNRK
jgi:hypothetical protein